MLYYCLIVLLSSSVPLIAGDLGYSAAYAQKALDGFIAGEDNSGIEDYLTNDLCDGTECSRFIEALSACVIRDGLDSTQKDDFIQRVRALKPYSRLLLLGLLYARFEYVVVRTAENLKSARNQIADARARNDAFATVQERREQILNEAEQRASTSATGGSAVAVTKGERRGLFGMLGRMVAWLRGRPKNFPVGTAINIKTG